MKWPVRILGAFLLFTALSGFAAWAAFPWYAQALLDRLSSGKAIAVKLIHPGRPGLSGIGFSQIDVSLTTPPDSCTTVSMSYKAKLVNAKLSWHRITKEATSAFELRLVADSVSVLQMPSDIRFSQANPVFRIIFRLTKGATPLPSVSPDSVAYHIHEGLVETGQLRLEGISYTVLLDRSHDFVQQPARFQAHSLISGNLSSPLSDFEATFGMNRNPHKPCTLSFSNCSLLFTGIRAYTPLIEYSLRNKHTAFDLRLDNVPLDQLVPDSPLQVTGSVSGSMPVEFLDTTLKIQGGRIDASKGTTLTYVDKKADGTQVSFDAGRHPGSPPLIHNLSASITINARNSSLSSIRLGSCSFRMFDGSVSATPATYDLKSGSVDCTVRIDNAPIFDRIRLKGQFSGPLNGRVSGSIPVHLDRHHFMIRKAKLLVDGGGSIRQRVPKKTTADASLFQSETNDILWSFSNPSIMLDMEKNGRTTITFNINSLSRKTGSGELLLSSPEGTITLFSNPANPAALTLSNFSSGLFGGSISIPKAEYDPKKLKTETEIRFTGIPIQKLLDLQGTKKLSATGTLRATIPVRVDGRAFSIPEGIMNAESNGIIIYESTPEERTMAGAGMRLTYEALGNFNYSELLSTISMQPDGSSLMSVKLKGRNPDFQNNREVNLNLNIEQNLLDLFRSLSISSDIEESISRNTLKAGKKRVKSQY